ncbi:MAG: pimeloyl-ACP methyl ester carboxylesterase [Alphaproteobacteria bacterium]
MLENDMIATYRTVQGTPKSAMLLIHGWAGQMDEVGDLYKRLAEQLSKQGIASLRINIRGESKQAASNYNLTSTFESRVADAQFGLKFLQDTYSGLPIGVVVCSLGDSTATAIALAGHHPEQISSIVLWSSAGNPDTVGEHLLNAEQRNEVLEKGTVVIDDWTVFTITKQHLVGMNGYDIFTPFNAYSGALLCIRGTNEPIPDIDRKIIDTASGKLKEYCHISGADNIFDVLDPKTQYDERVLAQTVTWLDDTL